MKVMVYADYWEDEALDAVSFHKVAPRPRLEALLHFRSFDDPRNRYPARITMSQSRTG